MATHFQSPDGDLETIFVTDYAMVDQFAKTGSLWTWGLNSEGQLGDGTTINKSSPVQTIAGGTNWKQVSGGYGHAAAIKTDGTLWLWGGGSYFNKVGQLGDGTTTNKSSPVQTISGGTNWKQVSCGNIYTAAVKTDGTLWMWGSNYYGQLGDNTIANKSSPVQTVAGGTNWKQVDCSSSHTAAIKTDGTLWSWGFGYFGQLGDNTNIMGRSSPVQTIAGGTNWKQVACGNSFTAAVKTDGTLWLWGTNSYGGLGDNTTNSQSSPVQTISASTNWKQVSCGVYHTAAVKTDGTLWTWGANRYGQVGDNTSTTKSSPVQTISAGTNWKQVSCGGDTTSATKTDGTLWLWGRNLNGNLGDNSTADSLAGKSSPVQTIAGGTNWKQVDIGALTIAIYFDDAGNRYPNS